MEGFATTAKRHRSRAPTERIAELCGDLLLGHVAWPHVWKPWQMPAWKVEDCGVGGGLRADVKSRGLAHSQRIQQTKAVLSPVERKLGTGFGLSLHPLRQPAAMPGPSAVPCRGLWAESWAWAWE